MSCLRAQVIELSSPVKLSAKASKFKIIGKNSDGIIVRLYGTEDALQLYTDDLRLSASKTLDFKNMDGELQYVLLNKTGAVVFYLQQDRKYSVLFAQPLNSKFLEIGKAIMIDTIFDRKDLVAQNLRFRSSTNQDYLSIYYPFFSGTTVQEIQFMALDQGLQKLYKKTVPFNRGEDELELAKHFVDNKANSYLLLGKRDKQTFTTRFDVFSIQNNGGFFTYNIETDNKNFGEVNVELDNKNEAFVVTSFYDSSPGKNEDAASGLQYNSYRTEDGQRIAAKTFPFPKSFIADLTGRPANENPKLFTFNIKKNILRNDGGAMILAESFIRDTREVSAPVSPMNIGMQPGFNSFIRSTIFQFNDIIAFSISPDGELVWNNILRKKQISEDDNGAYSSFLIMNQKDKLRLLYLDEVSASASLNEYVLTSQGEYTKKTIASQENKDVFLLPKNGKQIAPDAVVIPSYKNGSMQLMKITY
jgi:hypothetical protein